MEKLLYAYSSNSVAINDRKKINAINNVLIKSSGRSLRVISAIIKASDIQEIIYKIPPFQE